MPWILSSLTGENHIKTLKGEFPQLGGDFWG
jgi:hypothetical protein